MAYRASARGESFRFADLKAVMAAASPERSGDQLAGIAAESALQRVAANQGRIGDKGAGSVIPVVAAAPCVAGGALEG
ncbi:hypothetical protein DPM13_03660 [Paracoccus mutanolyticus]|uniref:Uncharacterized protein n=2 Tax=Paracoccus mutanolyticus TaxID=1499308 RepID=A0ABM6WUQ3_9RHOB|nr:hypothetical protein DPM13_03660 [Paracoccus mutanolyticus]